jgi:hypothetical protein
MNRAKQQEQTANQLHEADLSATLRTKLVLAR